MASVYRTRGRDGRLHPVWRFKFRDSRGLWRYGTGWPDRKKTLEHALGLEAEHRAVRNGEKVAPPSWVKGQNIPIAGVVADYLAWGRTCGGRGGRPWDDKNARQKELTLDWWVKELGLTVLADIDLVCVEKAAQKLLESGLAPKSVSLRLEALRSLCYWAVRRGLLSENPLRGLSRLDVRPREPHRALTDEELVALLSAAPPERRLWYEVALQTGFRVDELRHLTVGSLDRFGPSLSLPGDFTKNRKDARQPICRELAGKLTSLAEGRPKEADLLGIPRRPTTASEQFKRDARAARIRDVTSEGAATWHSLRKCYVNALVRSGADLKTVMELARHSTAALSMEVYASADPRRLREAAEAAAEHLRGALADSACCTGVARAAVAGAASDENPQDSRGLELAGVVGDTGLEPVTSSLSS